MASYMCVNFFLVLLLALLSAVVAFPAVYVLNRSSNELVFTRLAVQSPSPNVVHRRSRRQVMKMGKCPYGMIRVNGLCMFFEKYETLLNDYE